VVILGLEQNFLVDIAIIIVFATIVAYFAKFLKQPPVFSYIISGLILGPLVLNLIKPSPALTTVSHLGIAFLLYIVGMSLDFRVLKQVGLVSVLTGVGQVLFTTTIGFFILKTLGFSNITALYLAIGLAFSSTIIIVKLLSDKGDLDTLYGRIAVGFLIVQDFIAILALIVITGLSNQVSFGNLLLETLLKGLFLVILVFGFSRVVLYSLFKSIARSQELLFISGIAWLLLVSVAFVSLGFNLEIGAFLAGLSLASIPYNQEITRKIQPLRDFFIVLFFVSLGLPLAISSIDQIIYPAILLSLFVLIGNPIIVMIWMGLLGYKKRTSFLAGLAVGQISEFSLIITALGFSLGHVDEAVLSLITLVAIITIGTSTYMIIYSDKLYSILSPYLGIFEKKETKDEISKYSKLGTYDVILFGGHRIGRVVIDNFKDRKDKLLVIDYNPDIIDTLTKKRVPCVYGDVGNHDLLNEINLRKAKFVVSTIQNREDDLLILKYAKEINPKIKVIVTTVHMHEAFEFYKKGADYVLLPYMLSGDRVAGILGNVIRGKDSLQKLKKKHMKALREHSTDTYQLTS